MPKIYRATSTTTKTSDFMKNFPGAAGRLFSVLLMAGLWAPGLSAEQIQLVASKDNTLYENGAGSFSNGAGAFLFAGQTGSMGSFEIRRALIEFDLSAIPPGSTINSASVSVTINRIPQPVVTTDLAHLHRVQVEWGEGASDAGDPGGAGDAAAPGDATWIHTFFAGTYWASPGGDFEAVASATVPFGDFEPETLVFQSAGLTSDVQGWLDNPGSNHGWMLIADENTVKNARRFYSRESVGTNPNEVPILTVDFTAPSLTDNLELTEIANSSDGLTNPIGIVNAGDGSGRLFIVEQEGIIRILNPQTGVVLGTSFLNISTAVDSTGNEQGLLGLAFHPDYESNGQFFVYYTYDPGPGPDFSRLARYQVSGGDPNVANTTETILMEFPQDASNHNGGDMHFGTDGYLYIAVGDGGGQNDEYEHAQDVDSLKGKMLRIDVDSAPSGAEKCGTVANYAIPPGNAFPGSSDGCDEILHFGLRNPWRFSFDAQTGEMMIGDVGQGEWEEIDYAAPGASGINFGWSCREGAHDFPLGNACISAYTDPVIEYSSGTGSGNCSVTGGYVFRGGSLPLQGRYVYGDYCSRRIWIAQRNGSSWTSEEWPGTSSSLSSITSFGQDDWCNLYVADRSAAAIFRIDDPEWIQESSFEARNCQ